ncbi:MAG TPA: ferritin-like domain-containing protein [Solirubrobacteraceae bacterium]
MSETTRAQFLRRAGGGGLALVAGGSVLGLAQGSALGATPSGDVAIAKLAATAELLAIDFYTKAIASKHLKGDELSYLSGALGNEQAHYAALKGVLGAATPKGLMFKYPTGSFASRASIGKLGQALETAFVGAYMGAVTALQSNTLKGVAAEIGACESRHLSVLTNIASNSIIPAPDLPQVFTAAQATKAVTPFIA